MRTFDIYVDSGANLTDELVESSDIKVISYVCSVDGVEMKCYEKGVSSEETAKKFYEAMRRGCETKTTLLNMQTFIDAVTPSMEAGKDALICTISSQISGTNNQAKLAAAELMKAYPERKVLVFDPYTASLGEGLFAVQAAKLGDMGESLDECYKWLESHKMNMHSVFTVADLKYLRRGGRISATLAIAGTLLNIKPILKGDLNGKIAFSCNERGRKKALLKLATIFEENVINPEHQQIAIAHADCEEDALALADMLRERGAKDIVINMYDICTGSHVGPGTVALFFMGKERGAKPATDNPEEKLVGVLGAKKKKL